MNPFEQLRLLMAGQAQPPMGQATGQPTQAGPMQQREAMLDHLAKLGPPPDVPYGAPVREQQADPRPQQTPGNMQTAAGGNDQPRAKPEATSNPSDIGAALASKSEVKRKAAPILPGQTQVPQLGSGLGAALGGR